MKPSLGAIAVAMAASMMSSFPSLASAQITTDCNPFKQSCPPDPALSKSATFDFTQGPSNDWTPAGNVDYSSDGAGFTIAKQGDNQQLQSNFYIMFGKVDFVLKAAPGQGIVSTILLLSDCHDEIDLEWVGGNNAQVQSNYFRESVAKDFTRAAWHDNAGNQDAFKTYTIDWNKDRIIWQVDGATIRTVTAEEGGAQYPQTPAYIRLGIWAGGDPTNSPGTIEWAGGPTNFADGPFTMQVKSVQATDYSTGKEYRYTDKSGNWQSIEAVDGNVNQQSSDSQFFSAINSDDSSTSTSGASSATSANPSATQEASASASDPAAASQTSSQTSVDSAPGTTHTGAASKMYGTQALLVASSFWGFMASLF
ncbi:hypothetical protein FQN54_004338 [Arachnomyces sp. PD_36]|nr:hypothetical protein FQN54_004338 [Arachnomyces sp. PD_36]